MSMVLHHINYVSEDVKRLTNFYTEVLQLRATPNGSHTRVRGGGYDGIVTFLSDGGTEFHLAEKDFGVAFRTRNAINPLERGHIAFRTDDMKQLKERLAERNVLFSDYGAWAVEGWEQIFFHDPEGNIIEVHQVRPPAG